MHEKKLILAVTEEEIKAAIISKANEYKELYNGQKLMIVTELSGSFIFLADFIRELPLDVSIKFVAFNKGNDKQDVTLDLETKTSLKDENVLLLADVYNKGNALSKLYDIVKEGEPKDVRVLALTNRKNEMKNMGIPVESLFEMGEQKIVGYGLADNESYRGLKNLYYLGENDDE